MALAKWLGIVFKESDQNVSAGTQQDSEGNQEEFIERGDYVRVEVVGATAPYFGWVERTCPKTGWLLVYCAGEGFDDYSLRWWSIDNDEVTLLAKASALKAEAPSA